VHCEYWRPWTLRGREWIVRDRETQAAMGSELAHMILAR
jgi:hypothetical protein